MGFIGSCVLDVGKWTAKEIHNIYFIGVRSVNKKFTPGHNWICFGSFPAFGEYNNLEVERAAICIDIKYLVGNLIYLCFNCTSVTALCVSKCNYD